MSDDARAILRGVGKICRNGPDAQSSHIVPIVETAYGHRASCATHRKRWTRITGEAWQAEVWTGLGSEDSLGGDHVSKPDLTN